MSHICLFLVKNGRTKKELNQVIEWFIGFDIRQMEKLIDELAKGRKMEKILREEKK